MIWNRLTFMVPALLAALAIAAVADPITYNVTASDSTTGITITGTFTLNGSTVTNWSFDLSSLENTYSDFGSGVDPFGGNWQKMHTVDANGDYSMDPTNTVVVQPNNDTQYIYFEAYSGDNTSVAVNPKTDSTLQLIFPSFPGSFATGANFSQCTSCGGVYNFTDYFTSGGAMVATPEPPAWTLAGTGALLLAGLFWAERKRHFSAC
jgi:hypothetical protein